MVCHGTPPFGPERPIMPKTCRIGHLLSTPGYGAYGRCASGVQRATEGDTSDAGVGGALVAGSDGGGELGGSVGPGVCDAEDALGRGDSDRDVLGVGFAEADCDVDGDAEGLTSLRPEALSELAMPVAMPVTAPSRAPTTSAVASAGPYRVDAPGGWPSPDTRSPYPGVTGPSPALSSLD